MGSGSAMRLYENKTGTERKRVAVAIKIAGLTCRLRIYRTKSPVALVVPRACDATGELKASAAKTVRFDEVGKEVGKNNQPKLSTGS
jgi:hypothetical protein